MRAILIRDSNKMIAAAVLSSPKLSEPEVEGFARMASISDEILRIIGSNPTELQTVLDAITDNAARVCGATDAHVYRVEGQFLKQWAHFGPIPGLAPDESLPLSRGSIIGRSILDRRAIHIEDAG